MKRGRLWLPYTNRNLRCSIKNCSQRFASILCDFNIMLLSVFWLSCLGLAFSYSSGGNFGFPALGIYGAAIATVAGTVVGAAMSILSICKKDSYVSIFYLAKNKIRASIQDLRSIFNVARGVLTI